jgi:AraC family transcriptional regulator
MGGLRPVQATSFSIFRELEALFDKLVAVSERPATSADSAPRLLEAREHSFVVRASLRAPGTIVEVCDFPTIRGEEFTSIERAPLVSLGLSPLLPGSQGRYRPGPGRGFLRFGPLHFRPRGIPLQVRYAAGPFSSVRVRFSPEQFAAITGFEDDLSDEQLAGCLDIQNARMEDAMLRLSRECAAPGRSSEALTAALGTVVMVELARYLEDAQGRSQRRRGGLSARNLRRVAERVAGSGARPDVAELAHLCELSRHHFMRAFHLSTGLTVAKYVEAARVSRAKTLVVASDRPLHEIATSLGFSSAAAFSTVFRRATGRSPSDYRGHRR